VILGGVIVLVMDIVLQAVFRIANFGVENRGVSFGAVPEVGKIISIIAFAVFIAWFIFELIKLKKLRPFLFLIALGGLGNITGRIIWGGVWDYVCIPFLPFCFNLSDVLISFGVVSYILGVDGNRSTLRG